MRVGCSYGPQNPCHTLIPVELHQVLWYLKSMHYTHISLQDVRLHNCPSYFICIQKWRWQWHKRWIYLLHSQRTLNSFFFVFFVFVFVFTQCGGRKRKKKQPCFQWELQQSVKDSKYSVALQYCGWKNVFDS